MAEYSVEGIVLRRWDSGESDRRVAVLTPDRGKIYLTARGARKARARLAAYTEPGTYAKFAVGARKNAYMTQVVPIRGFPLRTDYPRLMCALALLEVIDAVSPEEHPVPEIYEETLIALNAISLGEPIAALCWADLRVMTATGHGPDFSRPSRMLSPEDGGAATVASIDAFEVSREVAIALSKLQQLNDPPDRLKFANDVAAALLRFWETYAGKRLIARRSLIESLA